MATDRKSYDLKLPEVRKPAGYGSLISVVSVGEFARELWFQHPEEPTIIRSIIVHINTEKTEKCITIQTRASRARES